MSWRTVCIGVCVAYRIASPYAIHTHIGGSNHHAAALMLFIVFVFGRIKHTRAHTAHTDCGISDDGLIDICIRPSNIDRFIRMECHINEFLIEREPALCSHRSTTVAQCHFAGAGAIAGAWANKTTDLFIEHFHIWVSWTHVDLDFVIIANEWIRCGCATHLYTCVTTNRFVCVLMACHSSYFMYQYC